MDRRHVDPIGYPAPTGSSRGGSCVRSRRRRRLGSLVQSCDGVAVVEGGCVKCFADGFQSGCDTVVGREGRSAAAALWRASFSACAVPCRQDQRRKLSAEPRRVAGPFEVAEVFGGVDGGDDGAVGCGVGAGDRRQFRLHLGSLIHFLDGGVEVGVSFINQVPELGPDLGFVAGFGDELERASEPEIGFDGFACGVGAVGA